MERRSGSIFIREPNDLLETGHIVEGHTHNFHHTTFFTSGKWKCEKFGAVVGETDKWYKINETIIQGGSPGSWLPIEPNCKHRFELIEGPGMYMCVYSHKDPITHETVEEYNGWFKAYS